MKLPKIKLSLVSNIIYVLVASTLSLLVFYDVSDKYGLSPMFSLIGFAVLSLFGLLIYKLLSYTSGSDFLKNFSDKGKYISVVIFTFLMIASVTFRCLTYMWSGLGGNAYFEIAKVTGEAVPHYVHPADEFYVQLLHSVFFLFGNRIYVAAITNSLLQLVAVAFGFIGFRKLLGNVPALLFGLFWTVSEFSVYEALTLNSRSLVFLLFMLAVFAISFAVPAREGKFMASIISGILIALCIYVDITGLVLIPFLIGELLFREGNENSSFSLRAGKTVLSFLSAVFGFVLVIIIDGFLSSSNPLHIVSAIVSRYLPVEDFTLGFSYMTSYTDILIMAVMVSLGIFVSFLSDDDTRGVLIYSSLIILLINNFGLTYLENDGRCILFTFCTLFAGQSLRELFPAVFTGDLFKASADIDNDMSYPDEGYVPQGLSPDELITFDDEVPASETPTAETPSVSSADEVTGSALANVPVPENVNPPSDVPEEKAYMDDKSSAGDGGYDLASFDAVNLKRPVQNQSVGAALAAAPAKTNEADVADDTKNADDTGNANDQKKPDAKPGEYVYRKPMLRPEYRRRPGAWMQQVNLEPKKPEPEKPAEVKPAESNADVKSAEVKHPEVKPQENSSPRVDENGVVLLDNPIPHPERKTEHKTMEYEKNVSDSDMDYDIKISDTDDFDV